MDLSKISIAVRIGVVVASTAMTALLSIWAPVVLVGLCFFAEVCLAVVATREKLLLSAAQHAHQDSGAVAVLTKKVEREHEEWEKFRLDVRTQLANKR